MGVVGVDEGWPDDDAPRSAESNAFDNTILPLLRAHCLACHGPEEPEGGLNLHGRAGMLRGGESGTAIVPGQPAQSRLIERVEAGEMPPDPRPKLTAAQIATLRQWIKDGAQAPDSIPPQTEGASDEQRRHWAFQPLQTAEVPRVASMSLLQTPLDAFILARLEPRGLSFSPEAETTSLARRLSLDLIGLPPAPDELDDFTRDPSEAAYVKLVDRLLASPHFGERWGRHWLDGAGYVDVLGGDNDAAIIKLGENKWLYRDYVVASFNTDKPFDRFLTEQLAGDELVDWRSAPTFTPDIRDSLVATGFLRVSADDTNENELNTLDIRYGVLHRTGEILAGNLLGLTVGCARCHDHKYEPIPQRDYYRFQAIFQPAFNPHNWLQPQQRQLPAVSPSEKREIEQSNSELDRQIAELQQQIDAMQAASDSSSTGTDTASLERQLAELNGRKRGWASWQVIYDAGPPTPTHILTRGNHLTPGEEVTPGYFSVLRQPDESVEIAPSSVAEGTSGRRLALAGWLTRPGTPAAALVLRVRVNRIWQHLFGRGLVETADNFGVTGTPCTHPELLDWLAERFAADGQYLKPFLRRLVLSRTYRQSASGRQPAAATADPENQLLWRQRLRRLESEAIRDALLAVSGTLDRAIGGAPVPVESRPDGSFVVPKEGLTPPASRFRRSIYLLSRRNYHPTVLAAFDQPHLTTNCTRRETSSVVSQSLTLLNDEFVLEQADLTARRAIAAAEAEGQVRTAFSEILGRAPDTDELGWCREMLTRDAALLRTAQPGLPDDEISRQSLARLCQTLCNTSEFLYIP